MVSRLEVQVPKSGEVAENISSRVIKTPKSLWLPFPMLFAAISNKISPSNMNLVNSNYELFMSQKITREEFVRRLRFFVGDVLLRSSIINLHVGVAIINLQSLTIAAPKQQSGN